MPDPAGGATSSHNAAGMDVTVVIPAYNSSKYIEETLESVRRQTRLPRSIHVVDDGSSDGTAGVVESWARCHPEIEIRVSVQENQGPASARNRGVERAQTAWIALLDADDVWLPWHLEWAVEALELAPDTDLYFSDELFVDPSGTPLGGTMLGNSVIQQVPTEPVGGRFYRMSRSPFRWLIFGSFIPPSTSVFRRTAALEAGLFNPEHRLVDDRDFFLRLTRGSLITFCTEVSARYRIHPESISLARENQLPLARGRFELVREIATHPDLGSLRRDERHAVRAALRREARGYLAQATWSGLREYATAVRRVVGAGEWMTPLQPRALARLLKALLRAGRASSRAT